MGSRGRASLHQRCPPPLPPQSGALRRSAVLHASARRQPSTGAGPGGQTALSAEELDLGKGPVPGGRGSGGEAGLPVEDPIGAEDATAGLGAGPSESRPAGFTVWPPEPERTSPAYQDRGRLANPGWWAGSGAP